MSYENAVKAQLNIVQPKFKILPELLFIQEPEKESPSRIKEMPGYNERGYDVRRLNWLYNFYRTASEKRLTTCDDEPIGKVLGSPSATTHQETLNSFHFWV